MFSVPWIITLGSRIINQSISLITVRQYICPVGLLLGNDILFTSPILAHVNSQLFFPYVGVELNDSFIKLHLVHPA